ncbi:hypothetical protein JCM19239_3300 [Vibrio variabilis]|uniref:DUF2513 domain-containing protein n=1 Tax=Vibrio variabilis TaxID=990271 RepID=A0ABQ0JG08_9VIBR|nr:hypothetical protein JCM19239_3300 [Vibrio variabilis]
MKRDMDLVRDILLYLEEKPSWVGTITNQLEGRRHDLAWHYHCMMLIDAGLVEGKVIPKSTTGDSFTVRVNALSWSGHELLETIRNDTVWSKTKLRIKQTSGTMSIEMIKSVANGFVSKRITAASELSMLSGILA